MPPVLPPLRPLLLSGLACALLLVASALGPTVGQTAAAEDGPGLAAEPDAPRTVRGLRRQLAEILRRPQEGGSLEWRLSELVTTGCLVEESPGLIAGLRALRRRYVAAGVQLSAARRWRAVEPLLAPLSEDGRGLTEAWLDSPQRAARLYLCDDGLPPGWLGLEGDAYLLEALTWFDVEVALVEELLQGTVVARREATVMDLMELRDALVRRFDVSYPADASHAVLREQLVQRLESMWEALVAPYHVGFVPRVWRPRTEAGAAPLGRSRFMPLAFVIPDPRDVIQRERIRAGWARQRRQLRREQRELEAEVARTAERLEEVQGDERAAVLRQASVLDHRLQAAISERDRLSDRVRSWRSGRALVDGLLDRGFKRRAVRRLQRRVPELQEQREALEVAVRTAQDGDARGPGGDPNRGEGSGGSTPRRDWLEGLAGAERSGGGGTSAQATAGRRAEDLTGTGWQERRYEGPLPRPSSAWDAALVRRIQQSEPSLDEVDARILLGLVAEAYGELPDRAAVEAAVRRSLEAPGGLRLLGEEATLSDLHEPGLPPEAQPGVTFVLRLFF